MHQLNQAHRILIPSQTIFYSTKEIRANWLFSEYAPDEKWIIPNTISVHKRSIKAILIEESLPNGSVKEEPSFQKWQKISSKVKNGFSLKLIIWHGKLNKTKIQNLLQHCDVVYVTQGEKMYAESVPAILQNLVTGYSIRETFRRVEQTLKKKIKTPNNQLLFTEEDFSEKWDIRYYSKEKSQWRIKETGVEFPSGIFASLPTEVNDIYSLNHSLSWSFCHPHEYGNQPSKPSTKDWTDPFGSHSARIKDIYIELENYTFFHSPSGLDSEDERLIGRESAYNRLRTILRHSKSKAGAYLITGFRGMGKTSLVRKVLRSIKPKWWHILNNPKIIIEISLAQDDLKDIDILRLLARKTYSAYKTLLKPFASLQQLVRSLFYLCLIFTCFFFVVKPETTIRNSFGLESFVKTVLNVETDETDEAKRKAATAERIDLVKNLVLWFLFLSLVLIFHLFLPRILDSVGITHHRTILKRLYWLNEKINAELSLERTRGLSPTFHGDGFKLAGLQFGNKSTRKYSLAGAKEIEGELVSILRLIDELFPWPFFGKPEFIYVFDELDKIDPHHNVSIIEKQAEDPDMLLNEKGEYVTESIRKRQQAIANILSNLKHFLNVARAKFIFIAGRELYDAALADISDRDAFWTSIFHETIYVESFLKDKSHESSVGITSMTEEYVCQFLIPKDFKKNHPRERAGLKLFNEFLKEEIFTFSNPAMCLDYKISKEQYDHCDRELTKMRQKTIYAVQNLIIYLTYRSNGTPKQLTSLFEKYIYTHNLKSIISKTENLVASKRRNVDEERLFLQFDFKNQYKFGLITYLFRPYLIANSRYMKGLDDKLLVATSYLTDHLFKFHPFGFSWKSLELTPEIITINRAPELRRLVEKLMKALLNLHLREIENGLFQFKFFSKTANEISYISRTFDLESAGFNFTLDESLMIKRHYKKKLRRLKEAFKHHIRNQNRSDYVHSIGFIDSILGDLHYYDVEYDDAIVQYDDAIQYLRHHTKKLSVHQFLLLLRNRMKIGLILERMKSYNSAIITYGSLIDDTTRFLVNEENVNGSDGKSDKIAKSFFQDIKLILLPFIAKLQTSEKSTLNRLTWEEVNESNVSVKRLLKELNFENSELLQSNYLRNIGAILFFKNGKLAEKGTSDYTTLEWQTESDAQSIALSTKDIEDWFKLGLEVPFNKDFRAPISAYQFYRLSLQKLIELLHFHTNHLFNNTAGKIQSPLPSIVMEYLFLDHQSLDFAGTTKNQYMALGHNLSKLGDCILGFLSPKKGKLAIDTSIFKDILALDYENPKTLDKVLGQWDNIKNDSFEMVFLHYILAALYYLKGGKTISYEFQMRKILYVLKDFISFSTISAKKGKRKIGKIKNINAKFLKSLEKALLFKILRALSWANDGTNRPQIFKAMDIFGIYRQTNAEESKSIYNSISIHSDTKEPNLLLAEIKMKIAFKNPKKEGDVASLSHTLVNPYASVSGRFVRVQELIYRSQLNLYYLKRTKVRNILNIDLDDEKIKAKQEKNKKFDELEKLFNEIDSETEHVLFQAFERPISIQQAVEHLIIDSLYCLLEAIKALKVFGSSYMVSYSYMGYTYKKLGDWSNWFQVYRNFLKERRTPDQEKRFIEKLSEMIGSNTIHYLQKKYYYELGVSNLFSALEVHQEGRAYSDIISNMYILEDDFNDNFNHFCAALERYRINVGAIRASINSWDKVAKKSKPYDNKNYVRPSTEEEVEHDNME